MLRHGVLRRRNVGVLTGLVALGVGAAIWFAFANATDAAVVGKVSLEVESGTQDCATVVNDAAASGGKAVQFGSAGGCGTSTPTELDGLSRIPWEGGSSYWTAANNARFTRAEAAGWSDPSFFPITVFLGKPSVENVALYKSAGVNTYAPPEHDPSAFSITNATSQGMYAIVETEYTPSEISGNNRVVGYFLSDECDMGLGGCRADQYDAVADQQAYRNAALGRNDNRFVMANFGNGVVRTYWSPDTMNQQVALTDVASADKYTYTSTDVAGIIDGWHDAPDWPNGVPVARAYSYGWQADQMRRFQNPSSLHPVWTFVETARPFLGESSAGIITPEQMSGAIWSALIHEARGISYFDHNNNNDDIVISSDQAPENPKYCMGYYAIPNCANVDCSGANASQSYCTKSTIACAPDDTTCADSNGLCVTSDVHCFVRAVDYKVKSLAPVLNTQSYYNTTEVINGFTYYRYRFNNGTDTMLKTYNGSAYIFAGLGMHCSNTTCSSGTVDSTGSKTFTLPAGVTGTTVEVVGEGRTLPVSGGKFTDTFPYEYSNHVYKVAI